MNFEVAPEFEKSLKRLSKKYQSLKVDYLEFLAELENNPMLGDEIFPNCKARIAIKSKGKGKRGGGRVVFYFEITDNNKIILLFIYDKSEMENVQTAFIEQILKQYLR
jgi:mRNA-degrading endonuclease RelE of RelBE toxin-antitoxin system